MLSCATTTSSSRYQCSRAGWLAHWGGDELILSLHDASPFAATEALLQRIVADVKASPVRLPQGDELTLTVTLGTRRYSEEDDWRSLFGLGGRGQTGGTRVDTGHLT